MDLEIHKSEYAYATVSCLIWTDILSVLPLFCPVLFSEFSSLPSYDIVKYLDDCTYAGLCILSCMSFVLSGGCLEDQTINNDKSPVSRKTVRTSLITR